MTNKDINLIKTSHVAMAIISKALKSDKNLNIFYIDASQNSIENREAPDSDQDQLNCLDVTEIKEKDVKDIFPSILITELGKIPGFVKDELEMVLKKFPQPRYGHLVKAMFEIAYECGNTDKQRAEHLGIERGKFQYWKTKFNLGGTE